jgi:hypothetical protein
MTPEDINIWGILVGNILSERKKVGKKATPFGKNFPA